MAPARVVVLSGASRILLLCMLILLPVLMADRGTLVGGWHDRSVSDPDVQHVAAFAVDHYNQVSNSVFYSRSLEIMMAKSQVVEGMKYYLKILMVKTQCDKRSRQLRRAEDLGDCGLPLRTEQQREMCKFYIWSRPWLNDTRVTHMNCGQASS